jgi:hypothetical protein
MHIKKGWFKYSKEILVGVMLHYLYRFETEVTNGMRL